MKKLTAGIFTVLMGLVSVNAAEAAVASKGYVDDKVGVNTTAIQTLTGIMNTNKEAADATATALSEYKTSNDAAVAAAQKAGDDAAAALDTYKGTNDAAVKKVADDLAEYEEANDAAVLEVKNLIGDGGTVAEQIAAAVTSGTLNLSAYATLEGVAATYATKASLETTDGNVSTNATAIEGLKGLVGDTAVSSQIDDKITALDLANTYDAKGDAAQALVDAKAYTDTATTDMATNASVEGALALYTKTADFGALAMKNTVSSAEIDDDAVIAGKIADDAVVAGNLADNAVVAGNIAPNAVSDANIVSVASSKVDGLEASLAGKMPVVKAESTTGKYVLTANYDETTGATDYAWELIERGSSN